jgi:hypothetical protein
MARVAERRRAVALARHFREAEGLVIAQIAERLGRSPATVKAYFYDPSYADKRPTHSPPHTLMPASARRVPRTAPPGAQGRPGPQQRQNARRHGIAAQPCASRVERPRLCESHKAAERSQSPDVVVGLDFPNREKQQLEIGVTGVARFGRPLGSDEGVGAGGCSATRATATCACKSPRIRLTASTAAAPATAIKQVRVRRLSQPPAVDDAATLEIAILRADALSPPEICFGVSAVARWRRDWPCHLSAGFVGRWTSRDPGSRWKPRGAVAGRV